MKIPHERIQHLINIDKQYKSDGEMLASVYEEFGELARELKIEEKVFGNSHKSPDEGSKGEAVDLFICSYIVDDVREKYGIMMTNSFHWDDKYKKANVFQLLRSIPVELNINAYNVGQTAINIFIQRGGAQEEFLSLINKKLDKWESNQKE
ncbi:MAG: hypothetical protein DWQ19_09740 [Crenarchaeota archaeon]|nr:MAG: hypothetical protein DWQ19_09740 [Thermoproteota archaeon]